MCLRTAWLLGIRPGLYDSMTRREMKSQWLNWSGQSVPEILATVEERTVQPVGETRGSAARLFSNSAIMAVTNLAGRGIGYAYIILMAKRLGVHTIGAYAILVSTSM